MDKYFTNKYNLVSDLYGINVVVDTSGRWLCYRYIDKINSETDEVTFYDNYCERYILTYNRLTKEINVGGSFRSGEIVFYGKDSTLNPLPNFSIDVMQSFTAPVAFETLRRQADVIAKNYRGVGR